MINVSTSEWVSLGHPDKTADYISSKLLDSYLEKDKDTRFAVETLIKSNNVVLAGEVSSKYKMGIDETRSVVVKALDEIGYTKEYVSEWGSNKVIDSNDIVVERIITEQSGDIAMGVNGGGWGDQGIFFGMAVNRSETDCMPLDYYYAKKIGKALYDSKYAGIDIKTQVTVQNGDAIKVIVAIPMNRTHNKEVILEIVKEAIGFDIDDNLIVINGTGTFIKHGAIADCGVTGRKLALIFMVEIVISVEEVLGLKMAQKLMFR